jgi:pimeloyl-ACP methyl ester carboxylesterase
MKIRGQKLTRRAAIHMSAIAAVIGRPAQAAEAKPFKRGYVNGPYGQIHYRSVAAPDPTRTPLICLHSTPLSGFAYENWIVEMGRDRTCYAPDTPGYGGSDTPANPVEIPDFARSIAQFMDELKIVRADIMGYHTGSVTSVATARQFPDRIRKVVLVSAPIFDQAYRERRLKEIDQSPPAFDAVMAQAVEGYRKNGKGMFANLDDERYWDLRIEMMRHYRTLNWGYRAVYRYDLRAALSETRQPILVLNPQDDLWEKTPLAKPHLNAQSRIHDLPGWTHGLLDTRTAELAAIVRPFLDT